MIIFDGLRQGESGGWLGLVNKKETQKKSGSREALFSSKLVFLLLDYRQAYFSAL